MPTFTIETPAGKRLTIEAADEATAMSGAQQWHAEQTKEPSWPPPGQVSDEMMTPNTREGPGIMSRLAGITMSGAVKGLAHGIASSAALPGDVYAGRTPVAGPDDRVSPELIQRSGEMAALASPINPAVRIGDRMVTGAVRGKVDYPPAPTVEALKGAAKSGYEEARDLGVLIKPEAISSMAGTLQQTLEKDGINAILAPKTFGIIGQLQKPPAGSVATVANFETARRSLGHAAGDFTNPTEKLAASRAIEHLDNYLANIPPKDVRAGDAVKASSILEEARGNYAAAKRSEDIGARLTRAERQAAKSGSGSNIDNAIRQKISAALDSKGGTRGFNADEIAQMETVVRGTSGANAARKIGKLGVSDGLSLLLHAGAAAGTGGMSIPIAAAGTIARKIAEALTAKQALKLDEMIRSRSPLAQSADNPLRITVTPERAAIARALLESQAGGS